MIDTLIYQLDIIDYDGKFIFLTDVDETSTSAPILLNEHLDYYLEEAHWILHTVDDPVTTDIKEGIRPEGLTFKAVDVKTNPIGLTPYRHYYVAVYGQPILLPEF